MKCSAAPVCTVQYRGTVQGCEVAEKSVIIDMLFQKIFSGHMTITGAGAQPVLDALVISCETYHVCWLKSEKSVKTEVGVS